MSRIALVALVVLGSSLRPRAAHALPDLTPEIYEVTIATGQTVAAGDVTDGCAAAPDGRTLVRFGVRAWNVGADPLVLGATGCPDCTANPGMVCTNPDFECSPSGTPRAVFLSSSRYELLDLAGNVVALGAKRNYCFLDDCEPSDQGTFNDCTNDQGVSVGCFDDYEPDLACQYIDATAVPNITTGAFRLRVTIDPDNLLPDADRTNNVTEVMLPGCGDGIVQPGEQCEGGSCCDASCHFLPAETTCRAAAGPCDAAETCDGVSSSCPADEALPDGAPCGSGTPPCLTQACQGGACVARQDDGAGCLIADSCFAPGANDPADSCRRCDPSESPDTWTTVHDPSAEGVSCGVQRVSTDAEAATCPGNAAGGLEKRIARAVLIADRLATASAARRRLTRRLQRLVRQSIHLVEGAGGCSGDLDADLHTLRDQLAAMSQG